MLSRSEHDAGHDSELRAGKGKTNIDDLITLRDKLNESYSSLLNRSFDIERGKVLYKVSGVIIAGFLFQLQYDISRKKIK